MLEVLWHGRGGQGAFTAARLLGSSGAFGTGRYSLAFPSFGPERRGAPMRAVTKIDTRPIGNRSAVAHGNYVVYLDGTLFGPGWERELKSDGLVLVNSRDTFDDARIISIDADGISTELLGRPIPNTVFLGAIAALDERIAQADVERSIREYMPPKLHAKNIAVVEAVLAEFEELKQGGVPSHIKGIWPAR